MTGVLGSPSKEQYSNIHLWVFNVIKSLLTNPLLANSNQSNETSEIPKSVPLSAMKKSGNIQNAFIPLSLTQFFHFFQSPSIKIQPTRLIAFSSAAVSDSQHFYNIFYFFSADEKIIQGVFYENELLPHLDLYKIWGWDLNMEKQKLRTV